MLNALPLGFSLLWPIKHAVSLVKVVQQILYMASSQNSVVSSMTAEKGLIIEQLTNFCTIDHNSIITTTHSVVTMGYNIGTPTFFFFFLNLYGTHTFTFVQD